MRAGRNDERVDGRERRPVEAGRRSQQPAAHHGAVDAEPQFDEHRPVEERVRRIVRHRRGAKRRGHVVGGRADVLRRFAERHAQRGPAAGTGRRRAPSTRRRAACVSSMGWPGGGATTSSAGAKRHALTAAVKRLGERRRIAERLHAADRALAAHRHFEEDLAAGHGHDGDRRQRAALQRGRLDQEARRGGILHGILRPRRQVGGCRHGKVGVQVGVAQDRRRLGRSPCGARPRRPPPGRATGPTALVARASTARRPRWTRRRVLGHIAIGASSRATARRPRPATDNGRVRELPAMTPRHFLAALVLAVLATVPLPARQPAALQSSDLAGLRLRNIGPATMSGRVVDMDVVESDPYTMYVASSTGGVFRTTDNGVTWTPVFEREAVHSVGDIAVFQPDPEHHLGRHRRTRQPPERRLGRRRLQVDRCRQDVDQRRPEGEPAHRPHRPASRPTPTSPTWRRRARSGARAAIAGSTSRATAAAPGRARCTSTTTPA